MQSVNVNGLELEYEVSGTGEPVLLISPVIADGFLPLLSQPVLADRYQLIRYHRRGWVGRTAARQRRGPRRRRRRAARPSRSATRPHRRDTRAARRWPCSWRSTTRSTCTLVLLEPALIAVPSLEAFLTQVEPAFEA